MKKILLTLILVLIGNNFIYSQEKKLILATQEYGVYCNHEVYIDTAGFVLHGPKDDPIGDIRKRLYSKEGYFLYLDTAIYIQQLDSVGIPLEEQIVTLDNIIPNYREEYSEKFSGINSKFGNYAIKYYPGLNWEGELLDSYILLRLTFDSLIRGVDFLDYAENILKLNSWIDFDVHFPHTSIDDPNTNINLSNNNKILKLSIKEPINNLEIYTLQGKKILDLSNKNNGKTDAEVDISNYPPGMYFVRVNNSFQKFTIVR